MALPMCPRVPREITPEVEVEEQQPELDMQIDPALQMDIDPALRESSVASYASSSHAPSTSRAVNGRVTKRSGKANEFVA